MTNLDDLETEGMSRLSGKDEERTTWQIPPKEMSKMSVTMKRVQEKIEKLNVELAAARQKNKERSG